MRTKQKTREENSNDVIVCIGDMDGEFGSLESLIGNLSSKYNLFKSNDASKFNDGCRLITLGNYFSHGSDGLKVLEYLAELKAKNSRNYFSLLGNAEIDLIDEFPRVLQLQKRKSWVNFLLHNASTKNEKEIAYSETRHAKFYGGANFVRQFYPSDFNKALKMYVKSMKSNGKLGKWLHSLEPFHAETFHERKILFIHGEAVPSTSANLDLKAMTEEYKRFDSKYFKSGEARKKKEFTKKHFHFSPYGKLAYLAHGARTEFVDDLGISYLVTSSFEENSQNSIIPILVKEGRIIRMDPGLRNSAEPRALVFKKDGAYQFGVNSGEKKLIDY